MEAEKERTIRVVQEVISEADKAKRLIESGDVREANQILLAIHRTLKGFLRIQ